MGCYFSQDKDPWKTPAGKFVHEKIHGHCVVIFSKTSCPFCRMAKQVFNELSVPYEAVELNMMNDGEQVQRFLGEITGSHTVPRVFVNGTCIGGAQETKALYKAGHLVRMLRECNFSSYDGTFIVFPVKAKSKNS